MSYHYIGEDTVSNKWVFLDATNGSKLYFAVNAEQLQTLLKDLEQKVNELRSVLTLAALAQ